MDLNQAFATLKHSKQITVGAIWFQGRSLFGGVTAALMFAKLQYILAQAHRLRSMTVNFVAPIDAASPVELDARILRRGKSVVQGEVHLLQNGETAAVMLASFGAARPSQALQTDLPPPPKWPPPDTLLTKKDLNGLPLSFLHYLDLRWAQGAEAFSGAQNASFGAYTRFQNQQGAFTLAHLIALADSFPPSPSVLLKHIAPMSSLTWTLELLHEPENIGMEDFWQYQVATDYAAEGYGHSEARMWDKNGRLTLISRQTVTLFG